MMISHASFQQFRQVLTGDQLLFSAELKRVWIWQLPRQFAGHGFRGLPPRREDQQGSKIFRERFGDESRPIAANVGRHMEAQAVRVNFFEGYWPVIVADQDGCPPEPLQPFD